MALMIASAGDLVMLTGDAGDLRRWQSDDYAQSDGDETARMLAPDVLPMGMCALLLDAASCLPFAQQPRELFLSDLRHLAAEPVHT